MNNRTLECVIFSNISHNKSRDILNAIRSNSQSDDYCFYLIRESSYRISGVLSVDVLDAYDPKKPLFYSMRIALLENGWKKIEEADIEKKLETLKNLPDTILQERARQYSKDLFKKIQDQFSSSQKYTKRVEPINSIDRTSLPLYESYVGDKQETSSLIQQSMFAYLKQKEEVNMLIQSKTMANQLPKAIYHEVTCEGMIMQDPVTIKNNIHGDTSLTLILKNSGEIIDVEVGRSYERSLLESGGLKEDKDFYPNYILKNICMILAKAWQAGCYSDVMEKINAELIESFTQEKFNTTPVLTPTGHSYQASSIVMWLASKERDPLTQREITHQSLIVNKNLDQIIRALPQLEQVIQTMNSKMARA